ncbi:DUF4837 family protein [Flavobacterium sp.]|uniref:DUF4837 family protein n=1 Tax=Flavobacterium sp. TaxID=239 RepID=UPI0026117C4D|nr:DUF4837 family protein [Flavobacterium sp.]MDG2431863.1 DUF4837 family protein [Flavobacterium sp.]
MNKKIFITLIASFFLLFSCKKEEHTLPRIANGKINNIAIIVDDALWNGEVGDSVRNKFAAPVLGLPQEEPLFNINQYPIKLMEGFMTDSRNVIVIKRGDIDQFSIKKDEYASPQNVFHITGKSVHSILDLIEKKAPQIIKTIHQNEIDESQRLAKKSLLKKDFFENKFKISLQIPSSYELMVQDANFVWLKKEIISGNTSVLIYQVPLSVINNENSIVANIITMRDSIGSLYIHGKEPNTDMITEEAYAPYFFVVNLDGKLTYETKGTWELRDDFMSGPFINYAIIDKANDRVLVLEGFCYSPSKEKRDLMLELEAIIRSVAVIRG